MRRLWTNAITELKATKADLQSSKNFLTRVLETAPLPVLVVSAANGRIQLANTASERLTALPAEKLRGRRVLRLLEGADRREALRLASTLADAREPSNAHAFRVRTAGGHARLVKVFGARVTGAAGGGEQLILIAEDITEKHLAEEKLRLASNSHFGADWLE
jgi:PAS domain S-box-containing protein